MKIMNGTKVHPATYSDALMPIIAELIPPRAKVLDPMAGTGVALERGLPGRMLHGIEIDPKWRDTRPWVRQGNAMHLPYDDATFAWVVTSPTYANRMADAHNAKERCKPCAGTGSIEDYECDKCQGAGRRAYNRITYFHRYGEVLHPDNTGTMGWTGKKGDRYRAIHSVAWAEVHRVLCPGGHFILNVSDHIRNHEKAGVTEWHLGVLDDLRFDVVAHHQIETPRMRMGANRDARVEYESVIHLRKALSVPAPRPVSVETNQEPL